MIASSPWESAQISRGASVGCNVDDRPDGIASPVNTQTVIDYHVILAARDLRIRTSRFHARAHAQHIRTQPIAQIRVLDEASNQHEAGVAESR
jgi:hypothetical protein